ncbi:MAG: class I SAM-dependent methyltransferase [bacterium]|nr:class I SAM-dependent methyltransferase [bacterium]
MPTINPAQSLVDLLRQRGMLTDPQVAEALLAIPRHLFLPDAPLERVYADETVDVKTDIRGDATCSDTMPSMVAHLLQQLSLKRGQNVLHIGTGTGYVSALMAYLVGKDEGTITSLEIERDIAKEAQAKLMRNGYAKVNVVNTDGAEGYAPRAAYDRIVATCGVWDIPPTWIKQLKPEGRLIAPIWLDGLQVMASFSQQPDGTLYAENVIPSAFVYIRGIAEGPLVRKFVGSTELLLLADEIEKIDTVALSVLLSSDAELCYLSAPLNTIEYWYGFIPFLMLNEGTKDIFALYTIREGYQAFGMEGEGFALFSAASATFVPYYGLGRAHCFAGSDAFIEIETQLDKWQDAGRPTIDRLRLRLIPNAHPLPDVVNGKLYPRRHHHLHVWLE